jgi:hypothetical protein
MHYYILKCCDLSTSKAYSGKDKVRANLICRRRGKEDQVHVGKP